MKNTIHNLKIEDFKILGKEKIFELKKYGFEVWKETHLFFGQEEHEIITVKLND